MKPVLSCFTLLPVGDNWASDFRDVVDHTALILGHRRHCETSHVCWVGRQKSRHFVLHFLAKKFTLLPLLLFHFLQQTNKRLETKWKWFANRAHRPTCCISRCFFLSAFCFSVAVGGPVILPMIDPSKSMAVVGLVVGKKLQVRPLICHKSQESQVVFVMFWWKFGRSLHNRGRGPFILKVLTISLFDLRKYFPLGSASSQCVIHHRRKMTTHSTFQLTRQNKTKGIDTWKYLESFAICVSYF